MTWKHCDLETWKHEYYLGNTIFNLETLILTWKPNYLKCMIRVNSVNIEFPEIQPTYGFWN